MPTHFAMRRTQSPRSHGKRIARVVNRPTVGQCFDIEISRAIDGWLIRIPEIDGVAHARRRSAVELAARECIATRTGIPMGYVAILVTSEIV